MFIENMSFNNLFFFYTDIRNLVQANYALPSNGHPEREYRYILIVQHKSGHATVFQNYFKKIHNIVNGYYVDFLLHKYDKFWSVSLKYVHTSFLKMIAQYFSIFSTVACWMQTTLSFWKHYVIERDLFLTIYFTLRK